MPQLKKFAKTHAIVSLTALLDLLKKLKKAKPPNITEAFLHPNAKNYNACKSCSVPL